MTRTRLSLFAFGLVALPLIVGFASAQDTVTLAFKTAAGDTFASQVDTTADMNISGALDAKGKITTKVSGETKFDEAKEGWTPFTTTIKDVVYQSDLALPGMDPGQMVEGMKSVKTTAEMDATGGIRKFQVTGGNEVTEAMGNDPTATMGFMGLVLPKTPVKVGDTWKYEADAKPTTTGQFPVTGGKITNTYKLDKVETVDGVQLATISFDLKVDLDIEGPTGASTNKSTGKGTFVFDVAKGMITATTQEVTTTMDLGVAQVDQKSTISGTVKKKA